MRYLITSVVSLGLLLALVLLVEGISAQEQPSIETPAATTTPAPHAHRPAYHPDHRPGGRGEHRRCVGGHHYPGAIKAPLPGVRDRRAAKRRIE